jgi:hypothetical protein
VAAAARTSRTFSPREQRRQGPIRQGRVAALKSGKDFFDRVVVKDGKPHLRALTPVPVVMDKCIMCHENYRGVGKGVPIGALTYTVPIE